MTLLKAAQDAATIMTASDKHAEEWDAICATISEAERRQRECKVCRAHSAADLKRGHKFCINCGKDLAQ